MRTVKEILKSSRLKKYLLPLYILFLDFFWFIRSKIIRTPIFLKRDNFYLYPNSHITKLLYLNHFEEAERNFISNNLNLSSNVVNVGANIGLYTVLSANKSNQGLVYSFEPEINNFNKLVKNIQLNNLTNVRTYNCALGSKIEKMNLYRDSQNPNLDSHYTLLNNSKTNNYLLSTTDVITLDSFFDNIEEKFNFLIMDVEGYEKEVLFGGINFLKNNQDCIFMIEVTKNHDIIFDTMNKYNFTGYKLGLNNELIKTSYSHGNIIFKKS